MMEHKDLLAIILKTVNISVERGDSVTGTADALTHLLLPVVQSLDKAITSEDPFEWADEAVAAIERLATLGDTR